MIRVVSSDILQLMMFNLTELRGFLFRMVSDLLNKKMGLTYSIHCYGQS